MPVGSGRPRAAERREATPLDVVLAAAHRPAEARSTRLAVPATDTRGGDAPAPQRRGVRQDGRVAATTCPHGLAGGACLICKTLVPGPTTADRRPPAGRRAGGAARGRFGLVPTGVGGLVALAVVVVVAGWAWAAVGAVLRLLQLVAVAVLAGWVGWQLGVRHGRRNAR